MVGLGLTSMFLNTILKILPIIRDLEGRLFNYLALCKHPPLIEYRKAESTLKTEYIFI